MDTVTALPRYSLHEAGHAVACVLLGRRLCCVELRITRHGAAGRVVCGQHPRLDPRRGRDRAHARWMIEREVVITWAGLAAEELFRTKRDLRGLDDDAVAIDTLLRRLERSKRDREELGRALLFATRQILRENRRAVRRVAEALAARGRLGAAEVGRLVREPRAASAAGSKGGHRR